MKNDTEKLIQLIENTTKYHDCEIREVKKLLQKIDVEQLSDSQRRELINQVDLMFMTNNIYVEEKQIIEEIREKIANSVS